jgi:hypothetical protein
VTDVFDYINDGLPEQDVESISFTVDLERRRQVLADALRAHPAYYAVHLLAAARLWECPLLTFKSRERRSWWFELMDPSPHITVHFSGVDLSESQFVALTEHMHQSKDRALMRLSLGLNQLLVGECSRVALEVVGASGRYGAIWLDKSQGAEPEKRESVPSEGAERGVTIKLWGCNRLFGLADLTQCAQFSEQPVTWNSTSLHGNYMAYLARACVWSESWNESSSGAAEAYIVPDETALLVVQQDGVAVATEELTTDELDGPSVPGLVLLVDSPHLKMDASRSGLVQNEGKKSLVRDAIHRLRRSLVDHRADGRIRGYLLKYAREFSHDDFLSLDELIQRDAYQFESGYTQPFSMRVAAGGQALSAFSETHVLFATLGPEPRAHWLSLLHPVIHAADHHPSESLVALVLVDTLMILDSRSLDVCFQKRMPGLRSVGFTLNGEVLLAVQEEPQGTRVSALSVANDWEVSEVAIEANGRFEIIGNGVLWMPGEQSYFQLRTLGALQGPGVSCRWDSLQEVSTDGRWAICYSYLGGGFRSSTILVDLTTGRDRALSIGEFFFSHDSQALFCRKDSPFIRKTSFEALGLPHLNRTGFASAHSSSWLDPFGVIRELAKTQALVPWGSRLWKDIQVESERDLGDLEKETPLLQGRLPSDQSLGIARFIHKGPETRFEYLASRTKEGWQQITPLNTLRFSYSFNHLMWQSGRGVYRLSMDDGNVRFFENAFLAGAALCKKEKKKSRLLSPRDGQPGGEVSVAADSIHVPTGEGFQYLIAGLFKGLLVDVERAEVVATVRSRVHTNGEWLLREWDGQVNVKPVNSGRWRKLRNFGHAALHPSEPRIYLSDGRVLISWDLNSKKKPKCSSSRVQNPGFCSVAVSPGGRFVLVEDSKGVFVHDADDLSQNWFLAPLTSDEMEFHSALTTNWLTDRLIKHGNQLWYAVRETDWAEARLLTSVTQFGRVESNGQSTIILIARSGQIDIVDVLAGLTLGTLHIWNGEWFVFTPDGLWDSSTDELREVTPPPRDDARVPGLLFRLLKQGQSELRD